MTTFPKTETLTETELDRLGDFLKKSKSGRRLNLEELDGFFSALIAGPDVVMPSEYMPEVFGSKTPEKHAFESMEEANEIIGLMMRHWNDIAGTLSRGDVHLPILYSWNVGAVASGSHTG